MPGEAMVDGSLEWICSGVKDKHLCHDSVRKIKYYFLFLSLSIFFVRPKKTKHWGGWANTKKNN